MFLEEEPGDDDHVLYAECFGMECQADDGIGRLWLFLVDRIERMGIGGYDIDVDDELAAFIGCELMKKVSQIVMCDQIDTSSVFFDLFRSQTKKEPSSPTVKTAFLHDVKASC